MKCHGIITVLPLLFFVYSGCVSSVPVCISEDPLYNLIYGSNKVSLFVSGKYFEMKLPHPDNSSSKYFNFNLEVDPVTNKLWLLVYPRESPKEIYLYEIIGKTVEYKLTLQFDYITPRWFAFFDNKVVVQYKNFPRGWFVIVNLLTNERENIQLEEINGVYPFYNEVHRGYDGKSLIFEKGYYDIAESSYHFFEIKLQYSRYQSVGNLRIGLDDDGFIVYHNIYSNTAEKTSVKRNPSSKFYSTSSKSYYIDLDGRYLYYSKRKYGALLALSPSEDSFLSVVLPLLFLPFLPLWSEIDELASAKDWYRYNLDKGTTEYIMIPRAREWEIIELLQTEPKSKEPS